MTIQFANVAISIMNGAPEACLMKSALWKVTRSTRPASASRVGDAVAGFMREVGAASAERRASIDCSDKPPEIRLLLRQLCLVYLHAAACQHLRSCMQI